MSTNLPGDQADLGGLEPLFLVAPQKTNMPADMRAELNAHIEAELSSSSRIDYSDRLAGRISQGEQIKSDHTLNPAIKLYLCMEARKYILKISSLNQRRAKPDFQIDFESSWIVVSKEGDYNPIHVHSGDLSGIIYVSIPEQIKDLSNDDGKLSFIFGQMNYGNLDFLGPKNVTPSEGDLYIFPAWLQHAVYPFQGEGDRISFSFNLMVKNLKEDQSHNSVT